MEKLRQKLVDRGVDSFKKLQRTFRIMDDNHSHTLSSEEFETGVADLGVDMTKEEIRVVFKTLDKDGSGSLNIDEFMEAVTPPLPKLSKDIIKQAFAKMDKTGDQKLTVADLKGVYNVKYNRDFMSGKKTEDELLTEFLNNYEPDEASRDGEVTLAEFEKYYAGVAQNFETEKAFQDMMRKSYNL